MTAAGRATLSVHVRATLYVRSDPTAPISSRPAPGGTLME